MFLEGILPQKALPGDCVPGRAGIRRSEGLLDARVSASGYYAWKVRPPSVRTLRHAWLAGEIAQVHKDSGGTYGVLRVTAELATAVGSLSASQVELVMGRLGMYGLPKRRLPRGAKLGKPELAGPCASPFQQ